MGKLLKSLSLLEIMVNYVFTMLILFVLDSNIASFSPQKKHIHKNILNILSNYSPYSVPNSLEIRNNHQYKLDYIPGYKFLIISTTNNICYNR